MITPGLGGPRVDYVGPAVLASLESRIELGLAIARFDGPDSLPPPPSVLHPEELLLVGGAIHERRRTSFLAGRWVAKHALARLDGSREPGEFRIEPGVFSQPVVTRPRGGWQVTLSHTGGLAAAIAFPETHPMGVDVELVDPEARSILEDQLTPREREVADGGPWTPAQGASLLWTAKEALSKALRTGLTTPFPVFETEDWESDGRVLRCRFVRFTQYRVWACLVKGWALAVCHPASYQLELEVDAVVTALR